jgi:hypothetical protein
MLTVIFGAGASYDSDPSNPRTAGLEDRPPLANELFEPRGTFRPSLSKFYQCGPIVPFLRHLAPDQSIEEVMETLWQESVGPPPDDERVRQLTAVRFYLQSIIDSSVTEWLTRTDGITNYRTLLDEIRHARQEAVTLVTFNYDVLIEKAIERSTGAAVQNMNSYRNLDRFALFKVHGSVNWGRVVKNHNAATANPVEHTAAVLIRDAPSVQLTDEYRVVLGESPPIVRDSTHVMMPAIAVPVQNKSTFECPPSLLEDLKSRLRRTTHMLIVGWRAMDRHFVDVLRETMSDRVVEIEIVCGRRTADNPSAEVEARLEGAGIRAKYVALNLGFTDYVLHRAGRKLFEASRDK